LHGASIALPPQFHGDFAEVADLYLLAQGKRGTLQEDTPTSLRPNNDYLLLRVKQLSKLNPTILDFGCGNGALVAAARANGYKAYGAETYYDGIRDQDRLAAQHWGCNDDIVRDIIHGHLDFEDEYFDLVVHNQVFEHIKDLEQAVSEIHRVLKPGGLMIGIFPTLGVLTEPHLNLPCIHWLPRGRVQMAWARAMRSVGLGFSFWGEGEEWFQRAMVFLEERVFFRTRAEITMILEPLFRLKWIEPDWLGFRVPKCAWMLKLPGAPASARAFARIMAGVVVEAVKLEVIEPIERNGRTVI